MNDLARLYLRVAIKSAIQDLQRNIADAGKLAHMDAALNEPAKLYFAAQVHEYQSAIRELTEFQAGL